MSSFASRHMIRKPPIVELPKGEELKDLEKRLQEADEEWLRQESNWEQ